VCVREIEREWRGGQELGERERERERSAGGYIGTNAVAERASFSFKLYSRRQRNISSALLSERKQAVFNLRVFPLFLAAKRFADDPIRYYSSSRTQYYILFNIRSGRCKCYNDNMIFLYRYICAVESRRRRGRWRGEKYLKKNYKNIHKK